ncbi:MBL fold metallo-hydrolase [Duganella hordei]|uniref:MBL fold metallo-hydrolase n=1 Tax=Duganella hordei TaxID=2865934 RepID=UPI0030E8ED6D
MKKPAIITIPILPFGMVHCHLVIGTRGCVLIDTGIPGSEAKIERVLKLHGLRLQDIKLIVVTHAHTDHAGSAATMRELSEAPILAHAGDLDYYERRKPMTYCTTAWFGSLFLKTGVPTEPYKAFTPDFLLKDGESFDLTQFGLDGVARHTPGHTDGSISVQLATGDALVGDLVASGVLLGGMLRMNHAIRPPFEDDPKAVGKELLAMVDSGMQTFHMGHGGPLPASEVRRHALLLQGLKPGRTYEIPSANCTCSTPEAAEKVK